MMKMICESKKRISKFPGLTSDLLKSSCNGNWLQKLFTAKNIYPTSSARTSLFYAWKSMGLSEDAVVLLPSFSCNSVSSPLIEAGAKLKFFKVLPDLSYDWNELEAMDLSKVKVFLWIHFLGLTGDFSKALEFCKRNNLYLIEDCSHALLTTFESEPAGSFGDTACFSIRKTLPTLCGGALQINNEGFDGPDPYINRNVSDEIKVQKENERQLFLNYLKDSSLWREKSASCDSIGRLPEISSLLSDKEFPYKLDDESQNIIDNIDLKDVKFKLRRNFMIYLKHLSALSPIKKMDIGDAPTGFPVIVENRDAFRLELETKNIYSVCHWPDYLLPEGIGEEFPESLNLANSILTLPCHQDLSEEDIEYVCDEVKKLKLNESN